MVGDTGLECKIIASTKEGHEPSKEEIFLLAGHAAGVCYEPGGYDKLVAEPLEKTIKRARKCGEEGHHSVFGHPFVSLDMEDVPKLLAMLLNNQRFYNTSEKSGRFTNFSEGEGRSNLEREFYNKWLGIFYDLIKKYANEEDIRFKEFKVKTLAQENARYLLDFQVPTSFVYTTDIRTLNYIVHNLKAFREEITGMDRFKRTAKAIDEFVSWFEGSPLYFERLNREDINLRFFREEPVLKEEFGENFCTSLDISVACLAQAQRHRVITYEVFKESLKGNPENFYVPPILDKYSLAEEWISDLGDLVNEGVFPQATLLEVVARGTFEDLLTMARERLCGAAQLEIMRATNGTLNKYLAALRDLSRNGNLPEEAQARLDSMLGRLKEYKDKPKCSRVPCPSPCAFGPKEALERLI